MLRGRRRRGCGSWRQPSSPPPAEEGREREAPVCARHAGGCRPCHAVCVCGRRLCGWCAWAPGTRHPSFPAGRCFNEAACISLPPVDGYVMVLQPEEPKISLSGVHHFARAASEFESAEGVSLFPELRIVSTITREVEPEGDGAEDPTGETPPHPPPAPRLPGTFCVRALGAFSHCIVVPRSLPGLICGLGVVPCENPPREGPFFFVWLSEVCGLRLLGPRGRWLCCSWWGSLGTCRW